jgi:hypothetical protein
MKVFTSVISGIALASLGAASPQGTTTFPVRPEPCIMFLMWIAHAGIQVTIYDAPNFQGEGQTFPADGSTCHSIFPYVPVPGSHHNQFLMS